MFSRISSIASYLPRASIPSTAVEKHLQECNPHITITNGIIEKITGIQSHFESSLDEYNSTLAVKAAQKLFTKEQINPTEIDLLLFASAGQDLLEPATAHIVQREIGTQASVCDITNACNSFINALEIADAYIQTQKYKKILIVTGEVSTKAVKWNLSDRNDFKQSFAGYTMGDCGSAVLVEPSEQPGLVWSESMAESSHWDAGVLPGGGSRHPRGDEFTYFQGSGEVLKNVFASFGPSFVKQALEKHECDLARVDAVCVHQVSLPYLNDFCDALELDQSKVIETITTHGNVAAASLPLGLSLGLETNRITRGSTVLLIGLAGGLSLHVSLLVL